MLFYKHTKVVANQGILKQIINYFGVDRIIDLIEEDLLQIVYTESLLGIYHPGRNDVMVNMFMPVYIVAQNKTFHDIIKQICVEVFGKSGKGRRKAQSIEQKTKIIMDHKDVLDSTNKAFLDQGYVKFAARQVVKDLVPEITDLDNIKFNTIKLPNGCVQVASNINYAELKKGIKIFIHKHTLRLRLLYTTVKY